jgi:hypothetical protein
MGEEEVEKFKKYEEIEAKPDIMREYNINLMDSEYWAMTVYEMVDLDKVYDIGIGMWYIEFFFNIFDFDNNSSKTEKFNWSDIVEITPLFKMNRKEKALIKFIRKFQEKSLRSEMIRPIRDKEEIKIHKLLKENSEKIKKIMKKKKKDKDKDKDTSTFNPFYG